MQYRFIYVRQQYGQGLNFNGSLWQQRSREYGVQELSYTFRQQQALTDLKAYCLLQAGKGFVRIAGDARIRKEFDKHKAWYLHLFAGALPLFDHPVANVSLQFNGIQGGGIYSRDYLYDELLLSRNATSGVLSQFVFLKDAQLKTLYNGGLSEKWMLGAGFAFDTPLPLPVQPYFDAALYKDPFENGTTLSYSGGLALVVQKDVLEVYVPLVESQDIRNSLTYLDRDNILKRISVMLNLKALHPFGIKGY